MAEWFARPGRIVQNGDGMADQRSLSEIFVEALQPDVQEAFSSHPGLEDLLATAIERAHACWPEVSLPADLFLPFVAARIPTDTPIERALESINVGDLYLACGCASGDSAAAAAFSAAHFPLIEKAIAALEVPRAMIEDVRQTIFQKLFVGDAEREPKICHYAGEGDLGTWVRVVAVRQAIDILRKEGREQPLGDDQLPDLVTRGEDPELRFLKERYRVEFKEVFQEVLATLSSQDRNLLRYQLVGGLTLEQIAALYKVNRSTVVRWLQKVRNKLLSDTRRELSLRLRINREEFESVMRLIQSQLHVSVQRLLKPEPEAEPDG